MINNQRVQYMALKEHIARTVENSAIKRFWLLIKRIGNVIQVAYKISLSKSDHVGCFGAWLFFLNNTSLCCTPYLCKQV